MRRQRLSSVDESAQSNSDSLTGNSRDKRLREIMSEESDKVPSDSDTATMKSQRPSPRLGT